MFLCRKSYKNSRRHFFRIWRERVRICSFSLIICSLWMKFKLDVRFSRSLSNYLLNIQQAIWWKLFKLLIGESTNCFLDSAGEANLWKYLYYTTLYYYYLCSEVYLQKCNGGHTTPISKLSLQFNTYTEGQAWAVEVDPHIPPQIEYCLNYMLEILIQFNA